MDTNENPTTPTPAEVAPETTAPQTESAPTAPTEAAPAPATPQAMPAPQKKKGVPVALIVILCVLAVIAFLIIGGIMALFEGFGGDTQAKAKHYLEDRYGKDQGFSTGSLAGGSMFETGSVEYEFTSSKSDKRFLVRYSKDRGFSDNYYWILYEKEFNNYYYNKYGKALKSTIPYKFTVHEGNYQFGEGELFPLLGENIKYNSFDELVKEVQAKKDGQDLVVSLNVDYTEIGNDELDTLNVHKLEDKVFDVLYYKGLNAGTTYYLNIMMEGSGRTGLCPENLNADTVRENSTNSDDPDEEIWICQVELYKER